MNKRYLIFQGDAHSVVYFVQASSTLEAINTYIQGLSDKITISSDGIVQYGDDRYPHSLAYIEANEKIHGEWQIREMQDWVWQGRLVEAFCGESEYGVKSVIAKCRVHFSAEFPRARAKAFVWYFQEGTLVTFYRKREYQIKVIQRYLWNWNGSKETLEAWTGSHEDILGNLLLRIPAASHLL